MFKAVHYDVEIDKRFGAEVLVVLFSLSIKTFPDKGIGFIGFLIFLREENQYNQWISANYEKTNNYHAIMRWCEFILTAFKY